MACDEAKPSCSRCSKRNRHCMYNDLLSSYDSTPEQTSKRQLPNQIVKEDSYTQQLGLNFAYSTIPRGLSSCINKNDQMLYHHYINIISESTPFKSPEENFSRWDSSVRRYVMTHEFLYHGVLAFSSLHLATLYSNASNTYVCIALKHQNTALTSFRPILDKISSENCEASLAFGGLTILCTFAFPLIALPQNTALFDPVKDMKQIISLFSGVVTLYRMGWQSALDKGLAPFLRQKVLSAQAQEIPAPKAESSLNLLLALAVMHLEDKEVKSAYLFIIHKLRKTFRRVAAHPRVASFVFWWPAMVAPVYGIMLEGQDPIALIILAHWAVCLHSIQHFWFVNKWGKHIVKTVAALIGRGWQKFIEWPIQEERHQAIGFQADGDFYNFSNIRYGQPPLGNLRFRASLLPTDNSSIINNGSVGRICPQSTGAWATISSAFSKAYLAGAFFNYTEAAAALPATPDNSFYDPRTTEDCLFLDVYVPQKIFNSSVQSQGAPVLVWMFGGGYTSGEKNGDGQFDPTTFIRASESGLIFVAINYRLGAFGWLAGSALQADGTANAGLYDQRLALEWVQEYIYLFGGDKDRVTVLGKSAGAGSLMHQITAFGGTYESSLFSQAIVSSPAFFPNPTKDIAEQVFQDFLTLLNVSTLEEARRLPSEILIWANTLQISRSSYGSNTYGPVVDGIIAPALPGQLLANGSFDKSINIMVAHNLDEGLIFTCPMINNSEAYTEYLQSSFPHASTGVLDYIATVLYPPIFNGSYGYKTEFGRAVQTISDSIFTCNTNYLDRGFNNQSYAYKFSVYPGTHGQDTSYIFLKDFNSSTSVNVTIAGAMQNYIASFVVNGVPLGAGVPTIPRYGTENLLMNLSNTGIGLARDDTANYRCSWWQKALYY
ncbi:MAG: hypothetical protein M1834_002294 [Cirrosporium novae-zelandiae]|nr:MAG: hypothetical protein M1834_002294 [Cirrosporium novae-zelandiae]